MAKVEHYHEESESSVWNDAKPFVGDKVHKWLTLIDLYETLSNFGFINLDSDVMIENNNLKNKSRIKSMDRLIHSILTLIRNTKFALKTKDDKKTFLIYRERLIKIKKNLYLLRIEKKRGNILLELNINEELFDKVMDEIHEIIDDMYTKINKAGLIFTQLDEVSQDELFSNLEQEFTN